MGCARRRRSTCTDLSRGADLGRGPTAAPAGARSGSFLGCLRTGRAASTHMGFPSARTLLGGTASGAIVGRAQAGGSARAGAIVGCAAFGAATGCITWGASRLRVPVMGKSAGGPIMGSARERRSGSRAGPCVGRAGAVLGLPGGRRPERTARRGPVLGPARTRDCRLGRAQERRTGGAGGAELVCLAAASVTDGSATASASNSCSFARAFDAERGPVMVATSRACRPAEVP